MMTVLIKSAFGTDGSNTFYICSALKNRQSTFGRFSNRLAVGVAASKDFEFRIKAYHLLWLSVLTEARNSKHFVQNWLSE